MKTDQEWAAEFSKPNADWTRLVRQIICQSRMELLLELDNDLEKLRENNRAYKEKTKNANFGVYGN